MICDKVNINDLITRNNKRHKKCTSEESHQSVMDRIEAECERCNFMTTIWTPSSLLIARVYRCE